MHIASPKKQSKSTIGIAPKRHLKTFSLLIWNTSQSHHSSDMACCEWLCGCAPSGCGCRDPTEICVYLRDLETGQRTDVCVSVGGCSATALTAGSLLLTTGGRCQRSLATSKIPKPASAHSSAPETVLVFRASFLGLRRLSWWKTSQLRIISGLSA